MKLSDAVKVYAGSSEAAKAIIGSVEAWAAGGGSGKIARKYTLQAYNNGDGAVGYAQFYPTAWKFQGSHNDTDWTDIDEQTGQTSWSPAVKKEYTFANSTAYRYYRWLISAGASSNWIIIKEAEIMEAVGEGYGSDICTGGTASAGHYTGAFTPAKAFDNTTYLENDIWAYQNWTAPEWLKYDLGA